MFLYNAFVIQVFHLEKFSLIILVSVVLVSVAPGRPPLSRWRKQSLEILIRYQNPVNGHDLICFINELENSLIKRKFYAMYAGKNSWKASRNINTTLIFSNWNKWWSITTPRPNHYLNSHAMLIRGIIYRSFFYWRSDFKTRANDLASAAKCFHLFSRAWKPNETLALVFWNITYKTVFFLFVYSLTNIQH